jgi:protein ImuB
MKRIASLWLPRLAMERWQKASGTSGEQAVVLVVEAAHGQLIHAATDAALESGARLGGRLTDARALDPALQAAPADPAGDAALLGRLALWATRWSPMVEVDGDDGLRLDVTGVAHLFGGEKGLVRDIERRFDTLGLTVQVALASTAAAAWGLARYGAGSNDLAALPVAALRLPLHALHTLGRLGLKRIGDLTGIRRSSLARRFREADNPLDALDRMLGKRAEPLTAAPFDPPPRSLLRLKEPVVHPEAASQALDLLVPKLVRELEGRKLGARQLALTGFRVDGSTGVVSVSTAIPSREPRHLHRLLAGAMEKGGAALDPGFGFDGFALEASWWEPLGAAQDSLVEEPSGEQELARLVDRLSVKLGPDKVRRPVSRESHLPERANGWAEAINSSPLAEEGGPRRAAGVRGIGEVASPLPHPSPARGEGLKGATRLLDRPEAIAVIYATPEGLPRRFVWRRSVHDITRAQGPERIAPEWWRERRTARLRDYYRVEDTAGRRFWIFREGLAGDGRGGPPGWFIHGLFG